MSKSAGSREQRLRKAAELFESGNIAEADVACRNLVREAPTDGETLRLMARVHLAQGCFTEALDILRRIQPLPPGEAWLHAAMGNATELTGDPRRAVTYYRQAIAAGEKNPKVFAFLAGCLTKTGQPRAAKDVLRDGLAISPSSPDLLLAQGDLLAAEGNTEAAKAAYDQIFKLPQRAPDVNLVEAHLRLARYYDETGDRARAEKHWVAGQRGAKSL